MKTNKLVTALDAVTATTTSEAIDVSYAEKITLFFTRANHTSGSTVFTVTGSIDGTMYVTINTMIDNVTNAITEGLTRVAASSSMTTAATKMYSLDLENFGYKFIKVTATETTDGTHTAKVLVEY